jgi:hypothetical protein
MGDLPFFFLNECCVGSCRPPPINGPRIIAIRGGPILPKFIPHARAAASVITQVDRRRKAMRRSKKGGQIGRKRIGP